MPILAANPINGPSCPTCCSHNHQSEFDMVKRMLQEHDVDALEAYLNRTAQQRAKDAIARINKK